MPWFPDFISAAELARRQTRAAGQADPVAQYIAALNNGDIHALENVWPGEMVVYDPRAAAHSVHSPRGRLRGPAAVDVQDLSGDIRR